MLLEAPSKTFSTYTAKKYFRQVSTRLRALSRRLRMGYASKI